MRVISVNLNKRLGNSSARRKFCDWLESQNVDVVLAQEPVRKGASLDGIDIPDYQLIDGDDRVAAWVRIDRDVPEFTRPLPFCQKLKIGYLAVYNCYFDAYKQTIRARQLENLRSIVGGSPESSVLIVGDFNLAPNPEDGIFGESPSTFNSQVDRRPFEELISDAKLVDLQSNLTQEKFTVVRRIREKDIKFRCDLALISQHIAPQTKVIYDHSPRVGEKPFTDHSALIIDVPITVPKSTLFGSQPDIVHSHKTAMSRRGESPIARLVVDRIVPELGIKSVLDYGCGYGKDVEYYGTSDLTADGYDPHKPFGWSAKLSEIYDLVTCVFVLNILPNPQERLDVLREASRYLKPDGAMLVVTRSPVTIDREATTKGWEPHNDGYWSHKGRSTFQKGISEEEICLLAARAGLKKHPADVDCSLGADSTCVLLVKE